MFFKKPVLNTGLYQGHLDNIPFKNLSEHPFYDEFFWGIRANFLSKSFIT